MPTISVVNGRYVVDPPYQCIRVKSWAVDMTGEEPKLIYVYTDGKTQNAPDKLWIDVEWDSGGLSVIRNDATVTFLDDEDGRDGSN